MLDRFVDRALTEDEFAKVIGIILNENAPEDEEDLDDYDEDEDDSKALEGLRDTDFWSDEDDLDRAA